MILRGPSALTVVYRSDAGASTPFAFSCWTGVPADDARMKIQSVGESHGDHRLVVSDSRRECALVGVHLRGGGLSSCDLAARVMVASTSFVYVSWKARQEEESDRYLLDCTRERSRDAPADLSASACLRARSCSRPSRRELSDI